MQMFADQPGGVRFSEVLLGAKSFKQIHEIALALESEHMLLWN